MIAARTFAEWERALAGTGIPFGGIGRLADVIDDEQAAHAGIFADTPPALSRTTLQDAISDGWPLSKIAAETGVSVMTVRVELHRHQLFDAHRTRHRLR